MPKTKIELFRGTEYAKGQAGRSLDRVVIAARVDGLAPTHDDMNTAIDLAVGSAGTTAVLFGNPGLELAKTNATRVTDGKFWVTLEYGRTNATKPPLPGSVNVREEIDVVPSIQVGTVSWTTQLAGGGTTLYTFYRHVFHDTPQAITRFYVDTLLSTHPGTLIDVLSGKLNADSFYIGGRACGSSTVKFDGAQIQPVAVAGTGTTTLTKYQTSYAYSYRPTGWLGVRIVLNQTPTATTGGYYTSTFLNTGFWSFSNFTGALPLHT